MASAKYVATPSPQHGALVDLGPRLQMTKTEMLPEVMHQVDVAKFRQQVGDNLAARALGIIQFHVEIPQKNGVLTPEAHQGLLYIG